jgi:tryptophan-rich sensory protein
MGSRLHGIFGLVVSLALAYGAGFLGSLATAPAIDTWYATLAKPELSPPNWVFAPVWTTLYAFMAIAAWRVYRVGNACSRRALRIYGAQLVLNACWSFAFFGLKNPSLGLFVIIALLALILITAWQFYRVDRIAGYLFIPYILWVTFATYLNFALMRLN